jgi:chemotaxis protein MotB
MSAQSNARPIIKRKKVVKGEGHHGGAWKVAYADFVTAMMAFFMLMWLLGATTEKQRKGIADYFNPTIPINRVSGGGQGAFGGDSVFSEDTMAQSGTGAGLVRPTADRQARGTSGASGEDGAADKALTEVEEALIALSGESVIRDLIRRHVVTRLSDEGLVIELFDIEGAPLFTPDGVPSPALRTLMSPIVEALGIVVNRVAIESHVSAPPEVLRARRSWDLSIDRGVTVRQLLEDRAFDPNRIERLTGYGDRRSITSDPMAIRNNRIEIVVLRDLG